VIGHELRHDIVAVSEPAAPVMLERKAQRETKLVGIGGGQIGSVIGHLGRLDQAGERIKNI
jgi:3-dehydroquinate synthetase